MFGNRAIYDEGWLARTIHRAPWEAKETSVKWDGRDNEGGPVASGVYFYRLEAGTFVQTRKMVLMK